MNNCKQNTCHQESRIHPKRNFIGYILVLNKFWLIKFSKSNQLLIGNSRSYSRVRSWALTCLDTLRALYVQSAQLTLMDVSAVIPARSRGGKGVNLSVPSTCSTCLNRHGVTGIDLLHILPADQMATKRIKYFNTFIKENYLWIDKYLIADGTDQSSPQYGNDQAKVKSIINNLQINHDRNHPKSDTSKYKTTFWSKYFNPAHQNIFSRAVEKQVA